MHPERTTLKMTSYGELNIAIQMVWTRTEEVRKVSENVGNKEGGYKGSVWFIFSHHCWTAASGNQLAAGEWGHLNWTRFTAIVGFKKVFKSLPPPCFPAIIYQQLREINLSSWWNWNLTILSCLFFLTMRTGTLYHQEKKKKRTSPQKH